MRSHAVDREGIEDPSASRSLSAVAGTAIRVRGIVQRATETLPVGNLLGAAGLLLVILLPFLAGMYGTSPEYTFRGTLTPSGDESQYLAAVRLGMQGQWLWHDTHAAAGLPYALWERSPNTFSCCP